MSGRKFEVPSDVEAFDWMRLAMSGRIYVVRAFVVDSQMNVSNVDNLNSLIFW